MSMIKGKNIINLFQNSVLAQGLDREKIEEFLKSSKVDYKKYHEGEFIFREGDVPRKLYMLIEGQIKRIPWLAHDIGWERILENFRKHFS